MRRFLREHALLLVSVGSFLLIWLVGQSWAGYRADNAERVEHHEEPVAYVEYLRSAHFGEATFENWESEFLQMGAYVLLTVRLTQRGSAESKDPEADDPVDEDPRRHRHDPDAPWPVRHGGPWLVLYEHSLSIAFFVLFALAWLGHAITGAHELSSDQVAHGQPPVDTWHFIRTSEFWFQSMQNWQSEFLAVAAIVGLTVFLRQRGSSESKPVHAPNSSTGG